MWTCCTAAIFSKCIYFVMQTQRGRWGCSDSTRPTWPAQTNRPWRPVWTKCPLSWAVSFSKLFLVRKTWQNCSFWSRIHKTVPQPKLQETFKKKNILQRTLSWRSAGCNRMQSGSRYISLYWTLTEFKCFPIEFYERGLSVCLTEVCSCVAYSNCNEILIKAT